MKHHAETLHVATRGRGIVELTGDVTDIVANAQVRSGLCTVFIHHTSASLLICENADPQVRRDLEAFMARICPDGDAIFRHVDEGPDDMPAHVRSVLTQTSIGIPLVEGALVLGTWQGLFLWEHRTAPHQRRVTVSVLGSE